MTVSFYFKLYLATLAAFLAIDLLWLGVVGRGLYQKHLGFLLSPKPNWAAAFAFYLLFIVGVLVFAVVPGLQAGSPGKALLMGALFGLISYAKKNMPKMTTDKN